MPGNLNNLYLRPFSIAIYRKLLKLFFSALFRGYNLALRRKIVQNLIFVYLFFLRIIGGGQRPEPLMSPNGIAFLMLYLLVCNTNPLISIN